MKENNIKAVSLMDFLPKSQIKGFKPRIFETKKCAINNNFQNNSLYEHKDNVNFLENEFPSDNWIKENKLRGNEGEEFVKNLLIKIYGEKNVKKQPDYAGYDFLVRVEKSFKMIEVKTTIDEKYPFFISINELKKAIENMNNYFIYWVIIKDTEKTKVYILNNPVDILNLNKNYILRSLDSKMYEITTEEFRIKLKDDLIKNLELLLY
ncbi:MULTISPECIES: DUF3883 domain-containing protein [Clostridium]|uniref:DUF3883 domain-containing protein n=1 Tax=Clostridium TaxID=1485 RepID=UPI0008252864|nr:MULTISPECIES: DUF3883 domain-containing protein [Clostridium]PJI06551.1 DUF3883 domain-containing protein [Clostridium sp. CT7]